MKVEVVDKQDLINKTTSLTTNVNELSILMQNICNNLGTITSYEDIDINGAANRLANNFHAVKSDLIISSQNISNYITTLMNIDSETVATTTIEEVKNNNIQVLTPTSTNEDKISTPDISPKKSSNPLTKTTSGGLYSNPDEVKPTPTVSTLPTTNNDNNPISGTTPVQQPTDLNIDISKYHNNISNGFEVTTGNKIYQLSDADFDLLCAIVSAESDKSYDDALAVITTILNRCEDSAWIGSFGTNPVKQATAPSQFVVYESGSYKAYLNGSAPDTVKQAVYDAINGVRNHKYLSFRSNGSTKYSNNQITPTGNRYK